MSSPVLDLLRTKTILFLTTAEYSHAPSISDPYSEPANIALLPLQNKSLAEALALAGADVRFSSWKFPAAASTRATLCRFDVIVFVCCDGYVAHVDEFLRFLDQTLIPLQEVLGPRLRVVNDARAVRWNAAKEYLGELRDGGFRVCRTRFLRREGCDLEGLRGAVEEFASAGRDGKGKMGPVVLKPSVGASGAGVHLVQDPGSLTDDDTEHMEAILKLPGTVGSIMIQDFQPTIRTVGEYSLVYIGGVYSHAALKRPAAGDGSEWRVNSRYGGRAEELGTDELPQGAVKVGSSLCTWLQRKFGKGSVGYMRLDGVVAEDDGRFVIGEVELIEPEMWLTMGGEWTQRVRRFAECLLEERT